MTLRAMGPFNGTLPQPTGMIVAFIRNPDTFPYLKYAQLIAAPDVNFSYTRLDPDTPTQLQDLNKYAWGFDDYRPTGKDFQLRAEVIPAKIDRWDFPYTIGDQTRSSWQKGQGFDPKALYDQVRSGHAALHRATRVVNALTSYAWPSSNTGTPAGLLGSVGALYFDQSSGNETNPDGSPNPNFQIIKKTFQRVKRYLNLATNSVLTGEELVAVLPPRVAIAIAESGEMVNYLKQSPFAKELTEPNMVNWNLPKTYAGFQLVVEDTPRSYINYKADGTTVADVSVSTQKDYILTGSSMYFVSRPGGLDGVAGGRSYSTLQCWHHNGEARVEAFSEPKHTLTEGHVVLEDKVVVGAPVSGYALTSCLSPTYKP